jgi:hypothetical protein
MVKLLLLILALSTTLAFSKTYEFKKLYHSLGYDKQQDYFNSTPDQVMSIESYIDKYESFYSEINNFLRMGPDFYDYNGITPELAAQNVRDIDHIISKSPTLPSNIFLYRGLTLKWRQDRPFSIGEEFDDKAYVSTTTTFSVAEYFAKGLSSDRHMSKTKALFALYFAPQKVKGLLIDQGEDEVLLKHGQKFKIMKRTPSKDYDLYLVQICSKSCEESVTNKEVTNWWQTLSKAN